MNGLHDSVRWGVCEIVHEGVLWEFFFRSIVGCKKEGYVSDVYRVTNKSLAD